MGSSNNREARTMRSTILVFSIAIGFAFAATADQVVPEDADYALDDDLVEAHAKVQAMMAAGKTLADCRKLEDATKKDIEDAVRDGQKLLDSLPRGDHCENTGQGAVKLAQEAKEKADKPAITTAQSAHVKISSRSFSSINENECSWAFSSTAYTTAQATYKKAVKEHEIAVGRAGEAAKAVASAIAEAKQGKHDCLCKTQYDHTETFKRLSKDNAKNQKDWTFAFKLECVHSGKKVCKIPACPTVKPGDMTKFQFLKCMLKGGKTSVEMKLKGQGCCRYPGWNPAKNKGYMSEKDCMMECLKDRSCNAADIARPKNGKYHCHLFTHGTHATVMKTLTTQCNVKSATEKCFYKHHEETAAPSTKKEAPKDPCAKYEAEKKANHEIAAALKAAVGFPGGSVVINSSGKKTLDEVAKVLNKYAWMAVNIQGHSDAKQGPTCTKLVNGRAESTKKYLASKGCKNKMTVIAGTCTKKRAITIGAQDTIAAGAKLPAGCKA